MPPPVRLLALIFMLSITALATVGIVMLFLWVYRRSAIDKFGNMITVTLYSMKGCPYCEKFNPEWDAFTKQAGSLNVTAAKVMVDDQPDLVKKKGVSGFPTIRIEKEGKESDYEGQRTASALSSYIKSIS